ncbi:MAG: hypothetical protein JSW55_00030 [Chloroflexota bacterium]|nr:MAG: hypothetical protein JSW55_00030 [Chloroflexota bacterium]
MRKRMWLTVLLVVLLLVIGVSAVQAQTTVKGAIRGTVYNDTNADGVCGDGDPTLASIPIDFTPDGGQTISLITGADGTYGLASVTLATWRVTVKPPAGWVATSQSTITVVLSTEQPVAENVNFCLAQTTTGTTPPTTLPESGASAPPILLITAVLGVALLLAGTGLIVRDLRATG